MDNYLCERAPSLKWCRNKDLAATLAFAAGAAFVLASAATNLKYAMAGSDDFALQVIWGAVAVAASVVLTLAPSATINSLSAREWELDAEIAAKLTTRGNLAGCEGKWLESAKARAVCIEVAALKAERGRASRKAELEAVIADARSTLVNLSQAKTIANTDALALADFAKVLGFSTDVDELNRLTKLATQKRNGRGPARARPFLVQTDIAGRSRTVPKI